MSVDDRLRGALRREPGPADLAERVMARMARTRMAPVADAGPTGRGSAHARQPLLTLAACALIAIGAAQFYVVRGTVDDAARVTRQVRLALEITSEKLALVQRRVQESQP